MATSTNGRMYPPAGMAEAEGLAQATSTTDIRMRSKHASWLVATDQGLTDRIAYWAADALETSLRDAEWLASYTKYWP